MSDSIDDFYRDSELTYLKVLICYTVAQTTSTDDIESIFKTVDVEPSETWAADAVNDVRQSYIDLIEKFRDQAERERAM